MAGRGLFVVGTDTDVGKTQVAAVIVGSLAAAGLRVGVYKPVASGIDPGQPQSSDAERLARATGRPLAIERVCPQAFRAACAPHRSARAEGREVDDALLRSGLDEWLATSDLVVVEGAGGLCSPLAATTLVVDLACDLGLPLVVVDDARLGAVGRSLATVRVARAAGLRVAAVVLSHTRPAVHAADDVAGSHRIALDAAADLAAWLPGLPIAILPHGGRAVEPPLDWLGIVDR